MEFDVAHLVEMLPEIQTSFLQTLYMVGIS